VATYTTSALSLGAHSIVASYAGDTTFLGAQSSKLAVTVVLVPNFTITAAPAALTLQRGQTGTYVLTLTPINNYVGSVTVSCGSLPADVACSLQPAALQSAGLTAVQGILTVTTNATVAHTLPQHSHDETPLLAGGLGFLALLWRRKGRRPIAVVWTLCLLVGGLWVTGCGTQQNIAAAGTTQITITAADSTQNITYTLPLTLTLQ
jgi:hypothetical protein